MLPQAIQQSVVDFLPKKGLDPAEILSTRPLSGGSINEAFGVKTNLGSFFLKYNSASKFPGMFEKEAKGLNLLRSAGEIDVPEVIFHGEAGSEAFLLLEFIDSANQSDGFWESFGKSLARLHGHHANRFGLDHDNYMGSLYQYNRYHNNWIDFFIEERLERQIRLARENGAIGRSDVSGFERLYKRLKEIFPETLPSRFMEWEFYG